MPLFNFIKQEVRPNSISDMKVDASFRKISKNSICFHVWRIEEDRLEAENRTNYGTFVDTCAYIVYAASPIGTYVNQDTITREAKAGTHLERFIHFWLGQRVSEQKRSNVAHKIQELDSYFSNVSAEYRETQDHESARFLSYFKKGITIHCGIVEPSKQERLFQLRGRKWMRCVEMDDISWQHFGADCIMVLKTEAYVFIWIGRSSSTMERADAIDMAPKFQMKAAELIIVDDGYEQSVPEKPKNVWNSFLPLKDRTVNQRSLLPEKQPCTKFRIYQCGHKGTRLHLDQLDVAIPTKEDLSDAAAVYVLDGQDQGVWLWVGNQIPQQDNLNAMGNGRAFVKKKKYPHYTPVIRVVQGHEPIEFTRLFPNWHNDWNESILTFKPVSTKLGKLDAITLCQRPKMAADTQLIDEGNGERKIYCVAAGEVVELPSAKAVMFSTDRCYVVQYTTTCPSSNPTDAKNVGVDTVIYQWNGAEANAADNTQAENFALTSFEKLRQKAMFVQMCENDETPHFLQIFEGKLIVLQGDKALRTHSSNNNVSGKSNHAEDSDTDKTVGGMREHFVLKIHGDASYNSKAVEVSTLSSLNSRECYVVKTSHVWVWCGQSSTGDAREMAKTIGALLGESSLALEGKEPKEFWRSVSGQIAQPAIMNGAVSSNGISSNGSSSNGGSSNGSSTHHYHHQSHNGNGSPTNGGYLPQPANKIRPQAQLYLVWAQGAAFRSQEIIGYEQHDLSPECVYVLDVGLISYVWLGDYASNTERENYLKIANNYMERVPMSRRPTSAVAVVRQNSEPNVFKGFFDNWNHSLWSNYVSYDQRRHLLASISDLQSVTSGNSLTSGGSSGSSPLPPMFLNHNKEFDRHHKYPIAILQQETDLLPAEVNPLQREVHLTHDDFVSLFHLSFWEFDELPGWRKQELKKKHKLF